MHAFRAVPRGRAMTKPKRPNNNPNLHVFIVLNVFGHQDRSSNARLAAASSFLLNNYQLNTYSRSGFSFHLFC